MITQQSPRVENDILIKLRVARLNRDVVVNRMRKKWALLRASILKFVLADDSSQFHQKTLNCYHDI